MHILSGYFCIFNLGFIFENKNILSSTFFSFKDTFIHLTSIHLSEGCEDSKIKIIIKPLFSSCRCGLQSLRYPDHWLIELT